MNISFSNRDAVSGILKIQVIKEDYIEQVEAGLRDYRRKVDLPGFRKGMAPKGMINKIYGKHVLVEEINKLVSDNLFKYIQEHKLDIVGEPLPNKTEQKEISFDGEGDFEFYFDLALSPDIHVELTKDDKLTYYQVEIDDSMIDEQIKLYQNTFGTYEFNAEDVEEKDVVNGIVHELENGIPKEGGLVVTETVVIPQYIRDEEEKHKFIGAKKGSVLVFNPRKAYAGEEDKISIFLKVEKADAAAFTADCSFEIEEITRYKAAALDRELFDRVLGENVVSDENTFRKKVREFISEQYAPRSDSRFLSDIRTLLLSKAINVVFADDILKRWLLERDEPPLVTEDNIEEEYPKIAETLKFQLIRDSFIEKNEIKVENEDIFEVTRRIVKANLVRHGMYSVNDDLVLEYMKNFQKDETTMRNIITQAMENKFMDWLKGVITLDIQHVTPNEFLELVQAEEPAQSAQ
ncbi:MAG: trigger factor [Tannerellaceae bacterium]|jgi:trigger factor|nr:trigger factor [Tannerellaceae bacterium]